MTTTFNTRNTRTGRLQRLTEGQIRPFKHVLEVVPDDAKPYEPGMFKPGEVGEFKNPPPAPDAVEAAQAAYDVVLEDGHAPNSKLAREAKAVLDQAVADAEAEAAALVTVNEQIQDGEPVDGAVVATSEGEQ